VSEVALRSACAERLTRPLLVGVQAAATTSVPTIDVTRPLLAGVQPAATSSVPTIDAGLALLDGRGVGGLSPPDESFSGAFAAGWALPPASAVSWSLRAAWCFWISPLPSPCRVRLRCGHQTRDLGGAAGLTCVC
jgi:hypothetical protein